MKKITVLKLIVENIKFFKDSKFEIDFTNQMQVTGYDENHPYFHLGSTIYLPKYMVFKGVNASGKTTIMELISVFFDFYLNKFTLNDVVLSKLYNSQPIKSTLFYEYEGSIYKIITSINLLSEFRETSMYYESPGYNDTFIITDEEIYIRKSSKPMNKKTLYDINFVQLYNRKTLSDLEKSFLNLNMTMIGILNHSKKQTVISKIEKTNYRFSSITFPRVPAMDLTDISVIKYLDPSIKDIKPNVVKGDKINDMSQVNTFTIEFEHENLTEVTRLQLLGMLSAGTVKGMEVLSDVRYVLDTGGYYIVDEIEVHLNRTIILDIIKLFENHDTNPNRATLLFSTHYTEILDSFNRNDQIFIIHRNDKYDIELTNYSTLEKRNVLKKSDAYFADTFKLGSAISYKNYNDMRRTFIKSHEKSSYGR